MTKHHIFVPTKTLELLSLSNNGHIVVGEQMVLQTRQGFYVRGSVLSGTKKSIDALIQREGYVVCDFSVRDASVYQIFSRNIDSSDIVVTHEKVGEEDPESENYPSMLNDLGKALTSLALVTGLKPSFHFRQRPVCNPFEESDADRIHIVLGASPPGAVSSIEKQYLCGVRLDPNGYWLKMNGPTSGRGIILKDEAGRDFGQMLDSTIYLFAPQITLESSPLFSSEGGDLIRKMLQLVSKSLTNEQVELPESIITSGDEFAVYVEERLRSDLGNMDTIIRQEEEKADSAREDYRRALTTARNFRAAKEHLLRDIRDSIDTHAASDWQRLSEHMLIDKLTIVDKALHVKTRRIIAEENGVRYDFGEFTIRMRFGGYVSVWALCPTHPRGVAHPHISDRSSFCFGNAGIEIEKACSELRFADAVELILEWLANGYDATLADVKIEEWPIMESAS